MGNMCYAITNSVGAGGKNDPADVAIIQTLLIQNGLLPYQSMSYAMVTLIEAIKKFQAGFLLSPDGKVDKKGTTFDRLQGLGLTEMPASGGLGWYRYDTGDLAKSRIMHFGTAKTVQTVIDVAGEMSCGLPGVSFGVGDLSTAMGTNLGRHSTHLNGTNVDVRPLRTDGAQSPTNIDDPNYSCDNTLLLVDTFLAYGNVSKILFNDTQIIAARSPRVKSSPGHGNHLHIIMKS